MDGRNPAPPKNSWNDSIPLQILTNLLVSSMVLVRTDFVHPHSMLLFQSEAFDEDISQSAQADHESQRHAQFSVHSLQGLLGDASQKKTPPPPPILEITPSSRTAKIRSAAKAARLLQGLRAGWGFLEPALLELDGQGPKLHPILEGANFCKLLRFVQVIDQRKAQHAMTFLQFPRNQQEFLQEIGQTTQSLGQLPVESAPKPWQKKQKTQKQISRVPRSRLGRFLSG